MSKLSQKPMFLSFAVSVGMDGVRALFITWFWCPWSPKRILMHLFTVKALNLLDITSATCKNFTTCCLILITQWIWGCRYCHCFIFYTSKFCAWNFTWNFIRYQEISLWLWTLYLMAIFCTYVFVSGMGGWKKRSI